MGVYSHCNLLNLGLLSGWTKAQPYGGGLLPPQLSASGEHSGWTKAHLYGGGHDAGSEARSIHSHFNNLLLAYSTVGLIPYFAGTGVA